MKEHSNCKIREAYALNSLLLNWILSYSINLHEVTRVGLKKATENTQVVIVKLLVF